MIPPLRGGRPAAGPRISRLSWPRRRRPTQPAFAPAPAARAGTNRRVRPELARTRRRLVRAALALVGGTAAMFGAAHALSEGGLFRVREVRFTGLVHARADVLRAEAGLARRRWIFDDLDPVEAALRRDPLVRRASVRRELPGRLVVEVEERQPAAYWSGPELRPIDGEGRVLPLDPARYGWDLPVLMAPGRRDSAPAVHEGRLVDGEVRSLLRLVVGIRDRVPEIARRISVAELREDGRVVLHVMRAAGGGERARPGEVRLRLETPLAKVALLPDVIRDLELRRAGFESLDLSFADQIVVRPGEPVPSGGGPAFGRPAGEEGDSGTAGVQGAEPVGAGGLRGRAPRESPPERENPAGDLDAELEPEPEPEPFDLPHAEAT